MQAMRQKASSAARILLRTLSLRMVEVHFSEKNRPLRGQFLCLYFQVLAAEVSASQLRKEGMTIFLVEQNANQALKLADRGYVLENGHVVLEDTGDALLANEAVRSAYLGG